MKELNRLHETQLRSPERQIDAQQHEFNARKTMKDAEQLGDLVSIHKELPDQQDHDSVHGEIQDSQRPNLQTPRAANFGKRLKRWRCCGSLADLLSKLCICQSSSPRPFSLRYGFFVEIGGLICKDVEKICDRHENYTLTPGAVDVLVRFGKFIAISDDEIADKSKANLFGKILVCVQVTAFGVQCIARLAARFSLTLLELHTAVHVLCALAIYMFWWKECPPNFCPLQGSHCFRSP